MVTTSRLQVTLTFNNYALRPQTIFMGLIWFSAWSPTVRLSIIKRMIFVTKLGCVLLEVRKTFLKIIFPRFMLQSFYCFGPHFVFTEEKQRQDEQVYKNTNASDVTKTLPIRIRAGKSTILPEVSVVFLSFSKRILSE